MNSLGTAGSWLHKVGLDSYFNVSMPIDTMKEATEASAGLLENSWEQDPYTFQMAGMGFGTAAGTAALTGAAFVTSAHAFAGRGGEEAIRIRGHIAERSSFATEESWDLARKTKGAQKGVVKDYKTLKGLGGPNNRRFIGNFGKGNIAMWGAAIAASIAAPLILGTAGKVMDIASADARSRKAVSYDTRYFNTQQYDQSSYQQLGAAMNNYESKMMSISRIYHSRG